MQEVYGPERDQIIKDCLPELWVMARTRHSKEIATQSIDISLCGWATRWEDCCTIIKSDKFTQCLFWYNMGVNTHGISVVVNENQSYLN